MPVLRLHRPLHALSLIVTLYICGWSYWGPRHDARRCRPSTGVRLPRSGWQDNPVLANGLIYEGTMLIRLVSHDTLCQVKTVEAGLALLSLPAYFISMLSNGCMQGAHRFMSYL